jgi:hypothetical protein
MSYFVNRGLLSVVVAAAVLFVVGIADSSAELQLAYSFRWENGAEGWSTGASQLAGARSPRLIFVGDRTDLTQYALLFNGNCGWAIRGGSVNKRIKISLFAAPLRSHRNALSVNVRATSGAMVYKYSFGTGDRIAANDQAAAGGQPMETDLVYQLGVPYELYSIWEPGTGRFALGLKNLITGEDKLSGRTWQCSGGLGLPGKIDIDQEGGYGPVACWGCDIYMEQ